MIPAQSNPVAFLISAVQQADRMADIAERDGDDEKAEMLRVEAEKLHAEAQNATPGAIPAGEDEK